MESTITAPLAQNLIDFCSNRAHVYGFLSRCYEIEIDKDFAEELGGRFKIDADPALAQALVGMKRDVADISEEHLEHLAVVFNRIFFGMGPQTAQKAFPYESVYTSPDGIMMQEAYSRAVKSYREACLAKNPDFLEPEDHLAVELAFMKIACENCIKVIESGQESEVETAFQAQVTFLNEHLLNWIHPFVADMKKSAEEGFYYHLAEFTEVFLEGDVQALHEVLGQTE